MKLKDIFATWWNICKLSVTARDTDGRFLKEWHIGENHRITSHMWWDIKAGKLRIIKLKINAHNDRKKNGQPEMGWGVKTEVIPDALLNAEVSHITGALSEKGGTWLIVDVLMNEMEVYAIDAELPAELAIESEDAAE